MQLQVPYFKQQTDWSCAVACLEMVARFHGCATFDQVAIYNKLRKQVPGQRGQWCVYNNDLMQEAVALGFDVQGITLNYTSVKDMMQDIQNHLDNGVPLIASQRTAMQLFSGHSRLIVGWDPPQEDGNAPFVYVHDPAAKFQKGVPSGGANRKWKADDFARMWKPQGQITTGGFAIVIRKRLAVI